MRNTREYNIGLVILLDLEYIILKIGCSTQDVRANISKLIIMKEAHYCRLQTIRPFICVLLVAYLTISGQGPLPEIFV